MDSKLLIYDVDNTILDSSILLFYGWIKIAEGFNTTFFSDLNHYNEIIKKYNGNWEEFAKLEFGLHKNHHKKIIQIWNREINFIYNKYAIEFKGYKKVFKKLKEQGHTIAIATNNTEEVIKSSIHRILGKDVIIFSKTTHGAKIKPEPDMIVDLMEIFNFKKKDVLMIGDEILDLIAGTNAGVTRVLALMNSTLCPLVERKNFDYIIKKPDDIFNVLEELKE